MCTTKQVILHIPALSKRAQRAHILDKLRTSLLSVGQICDDGCVVTFDKTEVKAYKNREIIMTGKQEEATRLWTVDLNKLTHKRLQLINNLLKNCSSSAQELIEFLHAACFSPQKSILIKAIKNKTS